MICSASPSYGNTTRTRNMSPFITSAYRIVLHRIANLFRFMPTFIAYIIRAQAMPINASDGLHSHGRSLTKPTTNKRGEK